jgi:hypothetical protein
MDDTTTTGVNTGTNLSDAEAGGLPLKVCKYKDYFTSCLPSPQKSTEPVQLPMTGNAQIVWPNSAETMANGEIFQDGGGNLENIPINSNMKKATATTSEFTSLACTTPKPARSRARRRNWFTTWNRKKRR